MAFHQSTTKNKNITWLTQTLGQMPGENRTSGKYWVVSTRRKILALAPLLALSGCSAMSLQCGVDGDSSFVNINAAPQVLSQNSRNLAELCGFAYEASDET